MSDQGLIVGIDASNIRAGGGLTHLRELLLAWEALSAGIGRVAVWAGRTTLDRLPDQPWLDRRENIALNGSWVQRMRWSQHALAAAAQQAGCRVLFVPGSTYLGSFRPFVALSQNLLPFVPRERARYGLSGTRLRLHLLAWAQALTFRRAAGMIFLTRGAQNAIERQMHCRFPGSRVIAHGISDIFRREPQRARKLAECDMNNPFRWVYVSIIDVYKHQPEVVNAVCGLRRQGLPVVLDLIGPSNPPAMRRLERTLRTADPDGRAVHYLGPVPYEQLPAHYHGADGFIFASTCENLPNILIEAMAAALPIVSSLREPMPEVLDGSGICVDVENIALLSDGLRGLMEDHVHRQELAEKAATRSRGYTWPACARATADYLKQVAASSSAELTSAE
jgi:glycosyltransferase involved in cell wall biosynthesis